MIIIITMIIVIVIIIVVFFLANNSNSNDSSVESKVLYVVLRLVTFPRSHSAGFPPLLQCSALFLCVDCCILRPRSGSNPFLKISLSCLCSPFPCPRVSFAPVRLREPPCLFRLQRLLHPSPFANESPRSIASSLSLPSAAPQIRRRCFSARAAVQAVRHFFAACCSLCLRATAAGETVYSA